MTLEQQEKRFEEVSEELRSLMKRKGNDYASVDRLSNFKSSGAITQMGAPMSCLNSIAIKVARLGVLLSNPDSSPNNESVQDSVKDLIAYSYLLDAILNENVDII